MGLDIYLRDGTGKPVKNDKLPGAEDHVCDTGYLRSSYNQSGFDRICEQQTGRNGFWYIFGVTSDNAHEDNKHAPDEDGYEGGDFALTPDRIAAARGRLKEVRTTLEGLAERDAGFQAEEARGLTPVTGEEAALDLFREERLKWQKAGTGFGSYSSAKGLFCHKGLEVFAVIPGRSRFGGGACSYLVTKRDLSSYLQTCDYVAALLTQAESLEAPALDWSY